MQPQRPIPEIKIHLNIQGQDDEDYKINVNPWRQRIGGLDPNNNPAGYPTKLAWECRITGKGYSNTPWDFKIILEPQNPFSDPSVPKLEYPSVNGKAETSDLTVDDIAVGTVWYYKIEIKHPDGGRAIVIDPEYERHP